MNIVHKLSDKPLRKTQLQVRNEPVGRREGFKTSRNTYVDMVCNILILLRTADMPLTIKQISARVDLSNAQATLQLGRLYDRGLLERKLADRIPNAGPGSPPMLYWIAPAWRQGDAPSTGE